MERVSNIAVLELVPLVLAAKMWGHRWQRARILFQTDNKAVADCGISWSPKHPHLAKLFRVLASLAIENSFGIKIAHLPGVLNVSADAISRGNWATFRLSNPEANVDPCPVPQEFLNFLLSKF